MSVALDRKHFRGLLLRAIVVPALLVALIGGALAWQITELVEASERVRRTDLVIQQARHVYRRMVDVETGLRGYLITGDRLFLAPQDEARDQLPALMDKLAANVTGDPPAAQTIVETQAAYDDLLRYVDEMIALRAQGGAYAVVDRNAHGKAKMDAIRAKLQRFITEQEQVSSAEALVAQRSGRRTLAAAAALTALLGVALGLYVRRQMLAVSASYGDALENVAALNRTLEQRVAERTQRLSEANRELEAFSSSVSHDLRAPLRSVQGLATIVLEDHGDDLPPAVRDYARGIIASAERMDALIQDLLRYSRLSRAEIALEPVQLRRAVDDALGQLDQGERERADIRIDGPLPDVIAHRATLVQVLANLVSNALKFVAPGARPVVSISAERRGGWVRTTIRDDGIGIAPEHQKRIFRVFERLHGVETYPGTGIGLAIVQRGLERMGGNVGVDSAPSRGSAFWIELPEAEAR